MHFLSGSHKTRHERFKIIVAKIQTKNHPSCADPAQRNSFAPKVELKHPVVAAGTSIENSPHGRHRLDTHWQLGCRQALVQRQSSASPRFVQTLVQRKRWLGFNSAQKCVHRPHDIGVCVEGASGKTKISRFCVLVAFHQSMWTADDANRKTASQCFSIGNEICLNPKVLLCSATSEPETKKHFVQDQHYSALSAHGTQLLQPLCVGRSIEMGTTTTTQQGGVCGSTLVGMHGLNGVHQHASNIFSISQHAQGVCVHLSKRQRMRRRGHRIARAWLDIVPPAVIGGGKTHDFVFPGAITSDTNGLHDGLGTRHVKRNLLLAGDLAQTFCVVEHARVVGAQHRAQIPHQFDCFVDARFIEVLAEEVDAVGACDIDKLLVVKISQVYSFARAPEAAQRDMFLKISAKLKGHAVLTDQLEIRNQRFDLCAEGECLGGVLFKITGQCQQGCVSTLCDVFRGLVTVKPVIPRVGIAWNQGRDALCPSQVTSKRGRLCKRQLKSLPNLLDYNPEHNERDDVLSDLQCIKGMFVHGASH